MVDKKYLFATLGIITFFVFSVTMITIYVQENYTITAVCGCETSIYQVLVALASLGLFTGSITYYFHSKMIDKEKRVFNRKIRKTLDFLSSDEKKIITNLIESEGKKTQSKLSKDISMSNVKLHRKLKDLEAKKLIFKKKKGMTHTIHLNEELVEVFC